MFDTQKTQHSPVHISDAPTYEEIIIEYMTFINNEFPLTRKDICPELTCHRRRRRIWRGERQETSRGRRIVVHHGDLQQQQHQTGSFDARYIAAAAAVATTM